MKITRNQTPPQPLPASREGLFSLPLCTGEGLGLGVVLLIVTLLLILLASPAAITHAQMGGEDLPPGVTGDDVYRVSRKMYCDVCAGVPISDCPSPTCGAWRQEVAVLLGEGYNDDAILDYFAVRYGEKVSGVPIKDSNRLLALGLPAVLAFGLGGLVVWRMWHLRNVVGSRAMRAALEAGLNPDYTRPVPDNVDSYYLERFLNMVEDSK